MTTPVGSPSPDSVSGEVQKRPQRSRKSKPASEPNRHWPVYARDAEEHLAFEQWAACMTVSPQFNNERGPDGAYRDSDIQRMWAAWVCGQSRVTLRALGGAA